MAPPHQHKIGVSIHGTAQLDLSAQAAWQNTERSFQSTARAAIL
jgi:hypothetical protein